MSRGACLRHGLAAQFLPGVALATSAPLPAAPPAAGSAPLEITAVLGALVLVIALLLVTLWLLRRLAAPTLGPYPLKVLGSLAVGPRERLITVAVADVVLILGVGGGGGVRKLHTLPGLPPAARPGAERAPAPVITWRRALHAARAERALRHATPAAPPRARTATEDGHAD